MQETLHDSEVLHDWINDKREYWREQLQGDPDNVQIKAYISVLDDMESDLIEDGILEETREVRVHERGGRHGSY